jgi:hypothetical protein
MRDFNRIAKIMPLIEEAWSIVPDWRLGQLIENFKRATGKADLFYVEDDWMEEAWRAYIDYLKESVYAN